MSAPRLETEVLVVGGKLGGLSLAMALARAGVEVSVIDAARGPRKDHWGFVLWPPGMRALKWLGVADQVAARGVVLDALRFVDGRAGEWISVDVQRLRGLGPFVGVRPSAVDEVLTDAAVKAGVKILPGYALLDLENDARGMTARVKAGDREETIRARLVAASDGMMSKARQLLGLPMYTLPIPGQTIFTGIGGGVPFKHMRQALGDGWSVATTPIGPDASWIATNVHGADAMRVLRSYAGHATDIGAAVDAFRDGIPIAPKSAWLPRWEVDRGVLLGDAAHPIVPHLGLAGAQTLEDVVSLVEVILEARRADDFSARRLSAFREARQGRVDYARRISHFWGQVSTGWKWPIRAARDMHLGRLKQRPERMERFILELIGTRVPEMKTRLAVGMI